MVGPLLEHLPCMYVVLLNVRKFGPEGSIQYTIVKVWLQTLLHFKPICLAAGLATTDYPLHENGVEEVNQDWQDYQSEVASVQTRNYFLTTQFWRFQYLFFFKNSFKFIFVFQNGRISKHEKRSDYMEEQNEFEVGKSLSCDVLIKHDRFCVKSQQEYLICPVGYNEEQTCDGVQNRQTCWIEESHRKHREHVWVAEF